MYSYIDGAEVRVIKAETANRQGRQEGGEAKTREMKLRCVFTHTRLNEKVILFERSIRPVICGRLK